jgi:hypothetical protein
VRGEEVFVLRGTNIRHEDTEEVNWEFNYRSRVIFPLTLWKIVN